MPPPPPPFFVSVHSEDLKPNKLQVLILRELLRLLYAHVHLTSLSGQVDGLRSKAVNREPARRDTRYVKMAEVNKNGPAVAGVLGAGR
jgi:hypothetical protein